MCWLWQFYLVGAGSSCSCVGFRTGFVDKKVLVELGAEAGIGSLQLLPGLGVADGGLLDGN